MCQHRSHTYTEDQSKEPVFEVVAVEHGHGALMHVGSWACKTLCKPRVLLCMFPQTSRRCGVSGARVTSTALPSLCSGAHSEFGTVALWIRAVITMVISHKARSQEPTFQSGPIS